MRRLEALNPHTMSSVGLWDNQANATLASYSFRFADHPEPDIIKTALYWVSWPMLCSGGTPNKVALQGIIYVGQLFQEVMRQPFFTASPADVDAVDQQLLQAGARALRNAVLPNEDQFSRIECFHIGAIGVLNEVKLSFRGNARLTKRLAEVKKCMEIGIHDEYVRLMDLVLKHGMSECVAQQTLAQLELGERTQGRMRFDV